MTRITLEEAYARAAAFLGDGVEIRHMDIPPVSLYGVNRAHDYVFTVIDAAKRHIGGTQVVAVSKTTGRVRRCGTIRS